MSRGLIARDIFFFCSRPEGGDSSHRGTAALISRPSNHSIIDRKEGICCEKNHIHPWLYNIDVISRPTSSDGRRSGT